MKCPYNKNIQKTETEGYQCHMVKITVQFDNCIGDECPFYSTNDCDAPICRRAEAESNFA